MKLLVKLPDYGPGGQYAWDGRYPDSRLGYLDGSIPVGDDAVAQLSTLLLSPEIEDRLKARVILAQLRATLPAVWIVREAEDSPNLNRDDWPRQFRPTFAWSAHVDREDADAWCAMFQAASDALVDRYHWGESARRKFEVALEAGAPASQLRQPGATPRTEAFK